MSTLPEDQRLVGISPKAYEHPADRAATAALHSDPDAGHGGAQAHRVRLRARAAPAVPRRLGEAGGGPAAGHVGRLERRLRAARPAGALRPLPDAVPDHQRGGDRRGHADGDGQLAHARAARRARGAHGARARGRPHPLGPRALPHGADDPASRSPASGACRCSPACRCSASSTRCSSGSARPSCRATAPRRSSPATRWPPAARCSCWPAACPSRKLDLDAFMRQATEYEEWDSGWDRINRLRAELGAHPLLPRAPRQGGHGLGALGRVRPHPGRRVHRRATRRPTPRKEAGDAVEYYTERFRGFLKDTGAGMDKAGDRVTGAAGQDCRSGCAAPAGRGTRCTCDGVRSRAHGPRERRRARHADGDAVAPGAHEADGRGVAPADDRHAAAPHAPPAPALAPLDDELGAPRAGGGRDGAAGPAPAARAASEPPTGASASRGRTVTVMRGESAAGCSAVAREAREDACRVRVSVTGADQPPSPAHTAPARRWKSRRRVTWRTSIGAPSGGAPSLKRSPPLSRRARRRARCWSRRAGSARATGAGVRGGARAQLGQLRVERLARARRRVAVAVTGDALEDDRRAGRVAVGLAAAAT